MLQKHAVLRPALCPRLALAWVLVEVRLQHNCPLCSMLGSGDCLWLPTQCISWKSHATSLDRLPYSQTRCMCTCPHVQLARSQATTPALQRLTRSSSAAQRQQALQGLSLEAGQGSSGGQDAEDGAQGILTSPCERRWTAASMSSPSSRRSSTSVAAAHDGVDSGTPAPAGSAFSGLDPFQAGVAEPQYVLHFCSHLLRGQD